MYHFISGYTAKVAGTERGVTEPKATFSPCFGEPFLTLHPFTYAKLLRDKMKKHNSHVYLVNTGWSGGAASTGASRMPLSDTRRIITAILSGELEGAEFSTEPVFGLEVPAAVDGISSSLLPREAWDVREDYDTAATDLVNKFRTNFEQYTNRQDSFERGGPIL